MRFYKNGLAALAAAATVLAANPAAAASSSFAELSVSYKLYDLDPLDGIAASISFYNPIHSVDVGTPYSHAFSGVGDVSNADDNGLTVAYGNATHTGSFDFKLTASGSDSAGASFGSYIRGYRDFSLSAGSLVVFSGAAKVTATTTGGLGLDLVYSAASLTAVSAKGEPGYHSSFDSQVVGIYNEDKMTPESQIGQGTINVYLANVSKNTLAGVVYGDAQVWGYSNVTPVPEPETYAMLLAGLGLIGAAVRRRNKG